MARQKNALRKHEIAPFKQEEEVPKEGWVELARWIEEISDESEDETDKYADYAGDGTLREDVKGVTASWSYSGTFDADDEAQGIIKKMKRKKGLERKVWQRVTYTDGTVEQGLATVTDIIAGSGTASDYEEFSCKITYDAMPEELPSA